MRENTASQELHLSNLPSASVQAAEGETPRAEQRDRLQLEKELAETKTALIHAGKLAILGELCAGLAHELNNPLAIIRGSAELAAHSLDRPQVSSEKKLEEMRRNVQRIDQASLRMVKLVRDVLRLSRRTSEAKTEFSVGKSLLEAVEQVESLLAKSSIQTRIDLGPEEIMSFGDPAAIGQVWLNLLMNARDAIVSRQNSENGYVRVSVKRLTPTKVRITFEDNGCGMDQATQAQLFQPFFTTKEVGKGSGLGLSISQKIIEDHGGAIFCTSSLGQGTTLHIVLTVV